MRRVVPLPGLDAICSVPPSASLAPGNDLPLADRQIIWKAMRQYPRRVRTGRKVAPRSSQYPEVVDIPKPPGAAVAQSRGRTAEGRRFRRRSMTLAGD